MTRSSSILDPSGDSADTIYEAIGQKFLEQCSFDLDGSLSMQGSMVSEDLIGELEALLGSRDSRPRSEWVRAVKRILQNLTPADFAVHGKRICLAIMDCIGTQEDDPPIGPRDRSARKPSSPTRSAVSARGHKSPPLVSDEYSQFPKWLPTVPKNDL
jgi:hypothetical protein